MLVQHKTSYLIILLIGFYISLSGCDSNPEESQPKLMNSEFMVGDKLPHIELLDMNGVLVNLNEEAKKGPYLLNFWASWCVPCIAEMPDLVQLQSASIGVPPLRVISINMDPPKARPQVLSFSKKFNINFPVLLDPEWTSIEKLNIQGYPETFLVNSDATFLSINDPDGQPNSIRILSKRAWSGEKMKVALCDAIKTCSN